MVQGTPCRIPLSWSGSTCGPPTGYRSPSLDVNHTPVPNQLGNACLTRGDPVQVPAHSEVLRWVQVSGGGLVEGQSGLVEGVDNGGTGRPRHGAADPQPRGTDRGRG
ncbi:hypothetical protein SKAU_G00134460 [Synaphobranchus kaupii]|uniref:Uncharacterized protein n=1 Tax=Synaphobranchus kaupii TaxID=118154 RepID=A0A9Q1FR16_SYNKA|nr:hypothetical protein SKAU_G00134460 [Synaphobranchus kaupii]